MRELKIVVNPCDAGDLDAELKAALGSKVLGVSTYGDPERPISILLDDSTTLADDATAAALVATYQQRAASGYYRLLPAFQTQSQAFVQAYRAKMSQRATTFKQRMQAIH